MTCDLTNAELDAWIAIHVMKFDDSHPDIWLPRKDDAYCPDKNGCYGWNPTDNIEHCWLAQERVRELGKSEEYREAIECAFIRSREPVTANTYEKFLLYATPRARCEAIWTAIQATNIPAQNCGCIRCLDARPPMSPHQFGPNSRQRMVVCPVCGNKRCPRANWHGNECTGSNEPGQPGSAFESIHNETSP
jgi:hypothetical protein